MQLKIFTIEDIRSWEPCYDPARHLPEDWEGTALDILRLDNITVSYRLWVVLRPEVLPEKILVLFGVCCARRVQHLMKDQRSIQALDVYERFLNGNATREEFEEARQNAAEAVGAAVAAARVAWNAAEAAEAERLAAEAAGAAEAAVALRVAAEAAVASREAALAAEAAGAAVAAREAAEAAEDAVVVAEQQAQLKKLIDMIKEEDTI